MTLPSSGPLSLNDIQGEFGGSNPIGMNEYYAGGGLVPAGTTGTYGAVPSSGALSVQNFYGTSNFVPVYVEDVFSTWLYTGNGSTQTITNGINVSGSGGLVWLKDRQVARAGDLYDTNRGVGQAIRTSATDPNIDLTPYGGLSAFNSSGFSLGSYSNDNASGENFVSWTFRKQPKFFDIVTWTGNGAATQTISHSLGAAPGCIMAKATSTTGNWNVYHQSLSTPDSKFLRLNTTQSEFTTSSQMWATTTTNFTVYQYYGLNDLNVTYVAYLFAHNAGGFGLAGSDNVISCGSFTTDGTGAATVNLGYEAQWVLVKGTAISQDWVVFDVMRGMSLNQFAALNPNTSGAESNFAIPDVAFPTSTGFGFGASALTPSTPYIYIAIRRGPMKVPTVGTTVFAPVTTTTGGAYTTNFPVDLAMARALGTNYNFTGDRLRGGSVYVVTSQTFAEGSAGSNGWSFDSNTSVTQLQNYVSAVNWNFRRAPGFFDEVCYRGTSTAGATQAHNLGVVPEMIIVKVRSTSNYWTVYTATTGNSKDLFLNTTDAAVNDDAWNYTTPTASVFTLGAGSLVNGNQTYVAYLFASCPGVSKVGSYTGTGALQTINCGFTSGARFVLIKRTDSTGDWYVWDSARGISSGSDPYLLWNTIDPEVTGTNYVDTTSVGFQVTAAAPSGINASGGTYIFLAIA